MGTPDGYHKGSNRVRLRIKRGTPPMTQYFWVYGTVKSDPHNNDDRSGISNASTQS